MKVKGYKVVSSDEVGILNQDVNSYIRNGYELHGELRIEKNSDGSIQYIQVLYLDFT